MFATINFVKNYHQKKSHVGPQKMYATLKSKYHWPLMYSDVYQWTKSCLECQQGKTSLKNRAPLRSLEVQANVFDLFHFDHLQLPESDGYHYVLVVIDSFSLFSVLLPAKTTTAEETARLLYENIFTVYTCKSLLCDRAAAFRSQLIKELCRLMNVKQVFTSARHPETNCRCEIYNKNILNALRTHCGGQKHWPRFLSTIGHSFRTSVVKNLQYSPFRVVFGFDPNLPVDILLRSDTRAMPANVQSYVEAMEPQFKILREMVKENQKQANCRTAEQYDKKPGVKNAGLRLGDRVWLLDAKAPREKHAHKVIPKFSGPYLIIGANQTYHVYKIQHCETAKVWPSWVHFNRLRLLVDDRDKFYVNKTRDVTVRLNDGEPTHDRPTVDERGREKRRAEILQPTDRQASEATTAGSVVNHDGMDGSADCVENTLPSTDWHEIKRISEHRKRGKMIFYKVGWCDDTIVVTIC